MTDPDRKQDLSLGYEKKVRSLREICEEGKRRGSHELIVAFDEFFRQYRKDTGAKRKLTPDMDEYVDKIKMVDGECSICNGAKAIGYSPYLSFARPLL